MHNIVAFGVILVALIFWINSVRSSLIGMVETTNSVMVQIGLQIYSQWEVLTSLLDLTEWYAAHECEKIIEPMKARRPITKDSSPDDVHKQETFIAETIREIVKVAESHPELKADRIYIKTIDAIHQYEDMRQTSRLMYNDSAAKLNRAITKFPASAIAGLLGFSNRRCF